MFTICEADDFLYYNRPFKFQNKITFLLMFRLVCCCSNPNSQCHFYLFWTLKFKRKIFMCQFHLNFWLNKWHGTAAVLMSSKMALAKKYLYYFQSIYKTKINNTYVCIRNFSKSLADTIFPFIKDILIT